MLFGWPEVVVCLVAVVMVSGSLEEDLRKFKAVLDQSKTGDILNGLAKDYPSYLRLCKAQIDVNRKNQALSDSLRTGIAALNRKTRSLSYFFEPHVGELEQRNRNTKTFVPYTGLSLIQNCEKIRKEYIDESETANIEAKRRKYRHHCKNSVIDPIYEFLTNSWRRTDRGNATYIQKFRQFLHDSPKMMDIFVWDWIKNLIRCHVLALTTYLLDPELANAEDKRKVLLDGLMRSFAKAKLVLKSVEDDRMIQVKEDLIRFVTYDTNKACIKSGDLLRYLKNKYEKTDIAVLVSYGNMNVNIHMCKGVHVYNVDGWNGIVVMRPAASDSLTKTVEKPNWKNGNFKSKWIKLSSSNYPMSERLLLKELMSKVGNDQDCDKLLLAAVINEDLPQCINATGFEGRLTMTTDTPHLNYTFYLVN